MGDIVYPSNRKEITDRIKSDVQSQLEESNPYLKNSFLQALIFGNGGRFGALYELIKNTTVQIFWGTASGIYLETWAGYFGITKNQPTESEGFITIDGTLAASIPLGTKLQTQDGLEVETQANATIANDTKSISSLTQTGGVATATTTTDHNYAPNQQVTIAGVVEAGYNGLVTILSATADTFTFAVDAGVTTPATGTITVDADMASVAVKSVEEGADNNLEGGSVLTLTTPIAGVNDTAYVQYEGLTGGANIEDEDDFKERFLFRVKNPVALFNNNAIINQSRLVAGVTRVWVENVDTTQREIAVSSITQNGGIATITFTGAHGMTDCQKIQVVGANEAGYNLIGSNALVLDATRIIYVVDPGTATPATGSIALRASTVESGQVKIYFTRDNDTSIIPSLSDRTNVKDKILEIKPGHVSDDNVLVPALTDVPVNVEIADLLPISSTLETAVTANLDAYFREQTAPLTDVEIQALKSVIYSTIDSNNGQQVTSFTLTTPAADVTIDDGEMPTLGTVVFT